MPRAATKGERCGQAPVAAPHIAAPQPAQPGRPRRGEARACASSLAEARREALHGGLTPHAPRPSARRETPKIRAPTTPCTPLASESALGQPDSQHPHRREPAPSSLPCRPAARPRALGLGVPGRLEW